MFSGGVGQILAKVVRSHGSPSVLSRTYVALARAEREGPGNVQPRRSLSHGMARKINIPAGAQYVLKKIL